MKIQEKKIIALLENENDNNDIIKLFAKFSIKNDINFNIKKNNEDSEKEK